MPSLFDLTDVDAAAVSSDRVVQILESGMRKLEEYGFRIPDAVIHERAASIATILIMEDLVHL